jgi:hypothetical protein
VDSIKPNQFEIELPEVYHPYKNVKQAHGVEEIDIAYDDGNRSGSDDTKSQLLR